MKKTMYTLLFSLGLFMANAKTISETDKYLLFIKTWNFLKYYHPEFTSGKIDADSFFIAKQKLLNKITSAEAFNAMLVSFIKENGQLQKGRSGSISIKQIIQVNPLHKWYARNEMLSDEMKNLLLQVYNNRDTKQHYYLPERNYDTEIPNERVYEFKPSENLPVHMRLLALAKLQGVIDYLYPHKKLMKENWDVLIKRNIPLFKNCVCRKDYEILILKVIANLNDSHAFNRFYTNLKFRKEIFKNAFYPPFDYKILNSRVLVTKVIDADRCAEAGIRQGDWITGINGQSVPRRIDTLGLLLGASNKNTLVSKLSAYTSNFIWSGAHKTFNLKVLNHAGTRLIKMDFLDVRDKAVAAKINNYLKYKLQTSDSLKGFMQLRKNIAYFNIDRIIQLFQDDDVKRDNQIDSIFNLAVKQKGIIFDMRGYPQWPGFIYTYLYKKFGRPDNRFAKYYQSNLDNVGTFGWNNFPATYHTTSIKPEQFEYKGKVVIIVNSATQSLSKWETMDLQSTFPQAKTIGEQTSGADGDEKHLNIPGNYKIYFTGNAIYYPDGRCAQGRGVKIDKVVHPLPSDILAGEDTLLNYAIKLIR